MHQAHGRMAAVGLVQIEVQCDERSLLIGARCGAKRHARATSQR